MSEFFTKYNIDLSTIISIVGILIGIVIFVIRWNIEVRKGTFDKQNLFSSVYTHYDKEVRKFLIKPLWIYAIGIKEIRDDFLLCYIPVVVQNNSNFSRNNIMVNLIYPQTFSTDASEESFVKILFEENLVQAKDTIHRWAKFIFEGKVEVNYKIDYLSPKSFVVLLEPILIKKKDFLIGYNFQKKDFFENKLNSAIRFNLITKIFSEKTKPLSYETRVFLFESNSVKESQKNLHNIFSGLLANETWNPYYAREPGFYYFPFIFRLYTRYKYRKYAFLITQLKLAHLNIKDSRISIENHLSNKSASGKMTYLTFSSKGSNKAKILALKSNVLYLVQRIKSIFRRN